MTLLDQMLDRFVRVGSLTLIDADGRRRTFSGAPGLSVSLRLRDRALERRLFLNPEMTAGEAYTEGTLVVEDGTIRDLLMLFAANRDSLRSQPLQKALRTAIKRLRKLAPGNTLKRARKNVAHHYDLSNELYRLFLDEEMNYSCAYFRTPDETLEAAQRNKLRHIAAKLLLRPGQKVLDIGCGWGAMAMYLAEHAQVEVLGVTLSKEQIDLARERVAARGLSGRVRLELMDYRAVSGSFDRIVSIGMFEHVGIGQHGEYFAKVHELLADDGVALVHTIGRMGGPGTISPWFQKYIFPGAHVPAISEAAAAAEAAKLWVTDVEVLRRHYAETLKHWDQRFQANRARIAAMFDERFCRMWEFYLIAGEIGFRYGKQMNIQMQLAKSGDALPRTREYMHEAEAALP